MRELLCGCTNDSDTLYMCIVICAKRDKRTLFSPWADHIFIAMQLNVRVYLMQQQRLWASFTIKSKNPIDSCQTSNLLIFTLFANDKRVVIETSP